MLRLNQIPLTDQYLIVPWPYCQEFLCYRDQIHLAIDNGFEEFGDSAHFIPLDLFARHTGYLPNDPELIFVKIDLTNEPEIRSSHAHKLYKVCNYIDIVDKSGNVYFISLKNVQILDYQRSKVSMNIPNPPPKRLL